METGHIRRVNPWIAGGFIVVGVSLVVGIALTALGSNHYLGDSAYKFFCDAPELRWRWFALGEYVGLSLVLTTFGLYASPGEVEEKRQPGLAPRVEEPKPTPAAERKSAPPPRRDEPPRRLPPAPAEYRKAVTIRDEEPIEFVLPLNHLKSGHYWIRQIPSGKFGGQFCRIQYGSGQGYCGVIAPTAAELMTNVTTRPDLDDAATTEHMADFPQRVIIGGQEVRVTLPARHLRPGSYWMRQLETTRGFCVIIPIENPYPGRSRYRSFYVGSTPEECLDKLALCRDFSPDLADMATRTLARGKLPALATSKPLDPATSQEEITSLQRVSVKGGEVELELPVRDLEPTKFWMRQLPGGEYCFIGVPRARARASGAKYIGFTFGRLPECINQMACPDCEVTCGEADETDQITLGVMDQLEKDLTEEERAAINAAFNAPETETEANRESDRRFQQAHAGLMAALQIEDQIETLTRMVEAGNPALARPKLKPN